MGYGTDFDGVLKFKNEMTNTKLGELNAALGCDRKALDGNHWYHIDLKLTDDFLGLEWNGSEKTCDLDHIVNYLIDKFNLELEGEMLAHGEEADDRWRLVIVEGRAQKIDWPRVKEETICPYCKEEYHINETD